MKKKEIIAALLAKGKNVKVLIGKAVFKVI